MKLQENLMILRKQKGLSQEELAYQLGVSRQSVSKWESGLSIPELDRLIEMADFYNVSLDELVRGEKPSQQEFYISDEQISRVVKRSQLYEYEYKSKFMVFGIPLVHIHFGHGRKVAKGIIALGNIAIGVISVGGLSFGIFSFGGLALGLIALAGIAMGGLAFGGLAIGIIAFGGFALGIYSCGGLAIASQMAVGGKAIGHVAIGGSPSGDYILKIVGNVQGDEILHFINTLPNNSVPSWIVDLLVFFR